MVTSDYRTALSRLTWRICSNNLSVCNQCIFSLCCRFWYTDSYCKFCPSLVKGSLWLYSFRRHKTQLIENHSRANSSTGIWGDCLTFSRQLISDWLRRILLVVTIGMTKSNKHPMNERSFQIYSRTSISDPNYPSYLLPFTFTLPLNF